MTNLRNEITIHSNPSNLCLISVSPGLPEQDATGDPVPRHPLCPAAGWPAAFRRPGYQATALVDGRAQRLDLRAVLLPGGRRGAQATRAALHEAAAPGDARSGTQRGLPLPQYLHA